MTGEPPHTVSDKYEISQLLFFPLLHPSFLLALSLSLALSSFNFPSHFPAPTNDVAIRIMDNEMGYLLLPGDRTVESQCPSPAEKMSSVCARVPVVLEMKERERGKCGGRGSRGGDEGETEDKYIYGDNVVGSRQTQNSASLMTDWLRLL